MSSVARPATGSRRPGTGSSRLRPGSSYRPGTGLRPKTGFQRLSQSTTLANGSSSSGSTALGGGITSDKLVSRPLTKHGLAAVSSSTVADSSGTGGPSSSNRLRTAMANRTVVDVSDYEIMLNNQQKLVMEEWDRLKSKLKAVAKLKRDRTQLTKEKQRIMQETQILEGNLADLNLALDKMRSLFIGSFNSGGAAAAAGSETAGLLEDRAGDETVMMSDSQLLVSEQFSKKTRRFKVPIEEKERVMGLMNTRLARLRDEVNEMSAKCDHLSLEKTRLDSEISTLSGNVSKMESTVKSALQESAEQGDETAVFQRYDSLLEQSHSLNEQIADKELILRELKNKYLLIHNALVQRDDSVETMAGSPSIAISSPNNAGAAGQDYVDIPVGITDPASSPDESSMSRENTIRVNLKGFDSKLTVHNLQNSLAAQKEKNEELEQVIRDYLDCLDTDEDGTGDSGGEQKLNEIREKMLDESKQHQSVIQELKNHVLPEQEQTIAELTAKLEEYQRDFEYMSQTFMKDSDKYEALFEREIKMQTFLDEWEEKQASMMEEKGKLEKDVQMLTEFMERMEKEKNQEEKGEDGSNSNAKSTVDSIEDQVQVKQEQKQSSELTLKLAEQQLEKTKKELAKIEALDRRIPIEMDNMAEEKQNLLDQIQNLKEEQSDDNDDGSGGEAEWKKVIRKEFASKKEALLREKMRSFQSVDDAMESVNKAQQSMDEFMKEQRAISEGGGSSKKRKVFSKEMIDFMIRADEQIEQLHSEIQEIKNEQEQCQSEASYHSQKTQAMELVKQINDLLIEEASLTT